MQRGIKNIDLRNKIANMQRFWVKRLLEDDLYDWKVVHTIFNKQIDE